MRIGLIGAGAVAPLHSGAADLLPDVTMTAVCDINRDAAAQVADPIGARVFTDYRDLLDSGSTDAVIVNTPHSLHRAMAIDAAKAGQHIMVEKPMAITLADCDAMIEAADHAGVVLRVGHIQHYLPDKRALAAAIADGVIGNVHLIHDFRTTDYRPGSRSPWFLDRELAGGGAVMNIGAHCLDRTVWFAGANVTRLAARTINRFDVPVETDATIQLTFADGTTAAVTVTSDASQRRDEVTVIGENGSLVANPRLGTLLQQNGTTTTLYEPQGGDIAEAFRLQMDDFHGAVQGQPSAVSLSHSRHVVELVLATYASNEQGGRPIALDSAPARSAATVA